MPTIHAGPAGHSPRLRALLLVVLVVSATNFGARLDREMVDVWDESLFAAHALDMHHSRQWLVTTIGGEVDYYDTKPPLNSWLIAFSFDWFGVGLVPLRLPAVLSTAATGLAVFLWAQRVFGTAVAALSALVLATSYPFLFVHSGRTANADAPLGLVVTLLFITLWQVPRRPSQALWTGPLVAAAIMLKGPAALGFVGPLVVASVGAHWRSGVPWRAWVPAFIGGGLVGLVPVGVWAFARWQFDGWQFLGPMIDYDIVQRASSAMTSRGTTTFRCSCGTTSTG